MNDTIITGAYDMHIHCGPDLMPRKMTYLEQAKRCVEAGMAGFVNKNHYIPTTAGAKIANEMYPECRTIGSITLNNAVGGMNPIAVDAAARDGAKVVWFPTIDTAFSLNEAEHMQRRPYWVTILLELKAEGVPLKPVKVMDENGKVLPEVIDVLDVMAKNDMILCTGHLSMPEVLAVVKAARERKVERIVCTHVEAPMAPFTIDEQIELVNKYGAYMEHVSNSCTTGKTPWDVCLNQIVGVGCDHVIISTDLGQTAHKYPDEGLLDFANWMLDSGISEADVRKTIRDNPIKLLS